MSRVLLLRVVPFAYALHTLTSCMFVHEPTPVRALQAILAAAFTWLGCRQIMDMAYKGMRGADNVGQAGH